MVGRARARTCNTVDVQHATRHLEILVVRKTSGRVKIRVERFEKFEKFELFESSIGSMISNRTFQ